MTSGARHIPLWVGPWGNRPSTNALASCCCERILMDRLGSIGVGMLLQARASVQRACEGPHNVMLLAARAEALHVIVLLTRVCPADHVMAACLPALAYTLARDRGEDLATLLACRVSPTQPGSKCARVACCLGLMAPHALMPLVPMTTLAGACLGHASPIASREEVVEALEHIYHTCGDGYEAVASRDATSGLVHSLHLIRSAHASEKDTARLDLGSFLSRGLFVNAQRLMEKCSPAFIAVAQGGTTTQWLLCALAAGLTPPQPGALSLWARFAVKTGRVDSLYVLLAAGAYVEGDHPTESLLGRVLRLEPTPARFEGMVHTLVVAKARCRMLMAGDLRPLEFLLVRKAAIAPAMLWHLLEASADATIQPHERFGQVSPLGMALGLGECLCSSGRRCMGALKQVLETAWLEQKGRQFWRSLATLQLLLRWHLRMSGPLACACILTHRARYSAVGSGWAQRGWPKHGLCRCRSFVALVSWVMGHRDFLYFLEPLVGVPAGMLGITDAAGQDLEVDNPRHFTRMDKMRRGDLAMVCYARECGWRLDGCVGWEPYANALAWTIAHAGLAFPAILRHYFGLQGRNQLLRPLLSTWIQGDQTPPAAASAAAYFVSYLVGRELRAQFREMLVSDMEHATATSPRWLVDMMWYGAAPWPWKLVTVIARHMLMEAAVMPKHRAAQQGVRAWGSEGTITVYRPDGGLVFSVEDPVLHKDLEWAAAALVGYAPQWGRLIQCMPNGDGFTNDPSGIIVRGCYQLILVNPMDGGTAIERQTFIRDSLLQDDPLSLTRAVELADGFARCWVWGSQLCPVVWALDQPVVVLIRVLEIMRGRAMPGGDRLRTALELAALRGDTLQVAILCNYFRQWPFHELDELAPQEPVHNALLTAVKSGSVATVYELLVAGSPPDRRTLHFALLDAVGYTAPLAVTRLLLCARADPGFEQGDDEGDETPFGLAVYNRMWDTVRLFLCNSIAHRPAEWL
ncbi:unnamed protein product [Symbiodinium sp. CCMP2592]|nr:unnamed protein product [Symbiodinium sp. CCMP2592]